eukprot:5997569-Karenia_brevis.AAC.1
MDCNCYSAVRARRARARHTVQRIVSGMLWINTVYHHGMDCDFYCAAGALAAHFSKYIVCHE